MNAKEYLNQIGIIEARLGAVSKNIERIRRELEAMDNISVSSSWGDGQPHGRKITDPTGDKATQLADKYSVKRDRLKASLQEYEHEQIEMQSDLWSVRMDITERLTGILDPTDPMSKTYYRILVLRYCECESWEQIAVEIGYTWRHTIRLHGTALKRMEAVLNGQVFCDVRSRA